MGACQSTCSQLSNSLASCSNKNQGYEPFVEDSDRNLIADLLQIVENRNHVNYYEGEPLRAIYNLAFSDKLDLQKSAALALTEISERDVRPVGRDALEPILYLMQSNDVDIQKAASAALGNLAVENENKTLIVKMGALDSLTRHMISPHPEVQCNAVGCITNLATHDENKAAIARSGALIPLNRLARSRDSRVQRNATGAILNMTHSEENRHQVVASGALPTLVELLSSPDPDVQYYCATAISNIAVDAVHRHRFSKTEPKLVPSLISLMENDSIKVQCQAALALRNLASDSHYQVDIVKQGGLPPLLNLLQSSFPPLILGAVACIRNISIHEDNERPIIKAGFLHPLIELLSFDENEEIQCHSISTIRNLAASSEDNKRTIVEAGTVERIRDLILRSPPTIQHEMTATLAILALCDDLKTRLIQVGVLDVLIPLTRSPDIETQGNSGAAIGNLCSKAYDYTSFAKVWETPEEGLRGFLIRFLNSPDPSFQHLAVWTIIQILKGDDKRLRSYIATTNPIISSISAIVNTYQSEVFSTGELYPSPPANDNQQEYIDESEITAEEEIGHLAASVLQMLAP